MIFASVQCIVAIIDIMNQSMHLLSLMSLIICSMIDGYILELGERQRLHTFLETSHSTRGNVPLSTDRLPDWIATLCYSMKG
jgi:hypothetical protein